MVPVHVQSYHRPDGQRGMLSAGFRRRRSRGQTGHGAAHMDASPLATKCAHPLQLRCACMLEGTVFPMEGRWSGEVQAVTLNSQFVTIGRQRNGEDNRVGQSWCDDE